FEFRKGGLPQVVTLSDGTSKTVNVLTVGASHVNAFVGVGNPDSNNDGLFDQNDDPAANGAIGLKITDLEFGLALLKPVAIADASSYYALRANAAGIGLVGVPGVILDTQHLDVRVNGASAPATGGATPTAPPPVVDFTKFDGGAFAVGTGGGNTVSLDMGK